MKLPDWFEIFRLLEKRNQGALKWDLPEGWVHAELFSIFNKQQSTSGWSPFAKEVPYRTFYPVYMPKSNINLKVDGAVKWGDLCLKSNTEDNIWCWCEFKVRPIGEEDRHQKAAEEARDAFRNDVVALMGFYPQGTVDIWGNPDKYTKAYWFETHLKAHAKSISSGEHHFIAAFLQLDGKFDSTIWNEEILRKEIAGWFSQRDKKIGKRNHPEISIKMSNDIFENHSLLVCEWALSE